MQSTQIVSEPGSTGSLETLVSLLLLLTDRAVRTLSAVRKQLAGPHSGVGSPCEVSCGKNQITYKVQTRHCCVAVSGRYASAVLKAGEGQRRRGSVLQSALGGWPGLEP